jgi:hypothetical protein
MITIAIVVIASIALVARQELIVTLLIFLQILQAVSASFRSLWELHIEKIKVANNRDLGIMIENEETDSVQTYDAVENRLPLLEIMESKITTPLLFNSDEEDVEEKMEEETKEIITNRAMDNLFEIILTDPQVSEQEEIQV